MSACKGGRALAPQLLEIFPLSVCLLVFVDLIAETRRCQSLVCLCWVPYAFEALHLFYRDGKIPFHLLLSLPSPWHVSFSHFQVNLKIHLTLHREQREKCFLEGKNKVFWCLFLSPQRTLRNEKRGETKNSFFLLFLANLNCPWGESGLHVW